MLPALARIEACASPIGSGAQPVECLPSCALVLAPVVIKGAGRKRETLTLWLDLRCLRDENMLRARLLRTEQEDGS